MLLFGNDICKIILEKNPRLLFEHLMGPSLCFVYINPFFIMAYFVTMHVQKYQWMDISFLCNKTSSVFHKTNSFMHC